MPDEEAKNNNPSMLAEGFPAHAKEWEALGKLPDNANGQGFGLSGYSSIQEPRGEVVSDYPLTIQESQIMANNSELAKKEFPYLYHQFDGNPGDKNNFDLFRLSQIVHESSLEGKELVKAMHFSADSPKDARMELEDYVRNAGGDTKNTNIEAELDKYEQQKENLFAARDAYKTYEEAIDKVRGNDAAEVELLDMRHEKDEKAPSKSEGKETSQIPAELQEALEKYEESKDQSSAADPHSVGANPASDVKIEGRG